MVKWCGLPSNPLARNARQSKIKRMAEQKKRSSKAKPKARVRKARAMRAEAAGASQQLPAKPLGAGGIELLTSDPAHLKEDLRLVNRSALNRWKPKEIAAEEVPDKLHNVILNNPDDEIAIKAADVLNNLLQANIQMDRLELEREELKLRQQRIDIEKIKAGVPGVQIINQVANVSNNPAASLTEEQRTEEIKRIEAGFGSQTVDAAVAGREEPVGTGEDVAVLADAACGDGAGPMAKEPIVLKFD